MPVQLHTSPAVSFAAAKKHSKLGQAARVLTVALATAGAGFTTASLTGCSPQTKSYYAGLFSQIPDPPKESRLRLDPSTESDGTLFISYVIWNDQEKRFTWKDIHYSTTRINRGSFKEMGGYEQRIRDGEVLPGGVIIDQENKRILLPSGLYVDGPTGDIKNAQGEVVKRAGNSP